MLLRRGGIRGAVVEVLYTCYPVYRHHRVALTIKIDRPFVKGGPKLDQSGGGKLDHPAARWRV